MSFAVARSLLFRLPPEAAHEVAMGSITALRSIGLGRAVAGPVSPLPVHAMGLEFPNPVGLAAGFDKNGDHLETLFGLGFGFVEIGTITPRPQPGNPKPRIFRFPAERALINRMGFNNHGLAHAVARVRQARQRGSLGGVLGMNIGKNKDTPLTRAAEDYTTGLREVYPLADYVVVNVSSPNTEGLRELQHGDALRALLDVLLDERDALADRHGVRRPLVLKIAPDLDEAAIDQLATVLNDLRPDGLTATNTTIDHTAVAHRRHGDEAGGLSGAPLRPAADEILARFAERLDPEICLIGVGGIFSGDDAVAKFDAGASLVQFYTGFVYRGPALIGECVEALREAGRAR